MKNTTPPTQPDHANRSTTFWATLLVTLAAAILPVAESSSDGLSGCDSQTDVAKEGVRFDHLFWSMEMRSVNRARARFLFADGDRLIVISDEMPPGKQAAVFHSDNGGVSWRDVGTLCDGPRLICGAIGRRDHLYVGTSDRNLYRSVDGGRNWSRCALGAESFTEIVADRQGLVLVVCKDGVLYRSDDDGTSWAAIAHGLTDSNPTALAMDREGAVYLGNYAGQVSRSVNGGYSWERLTSPSGNGAILSFAFSAGDIFVGSGRGRIFRSTDQGTTWIRIDPDLRNRVDSLAFTSQGRLFAVGHGAAKVGLMGLIRSDDNGASWRQVDTGIDNPGSIRSFLLTESQEILIKDWKTVYRSSDQGDSWSSRTCHDVVRLQSGDQLGDDVNGLLIPNPTPWYSPLPTEVVAGLPQGYLRSLVFGRDEYRYGCTWRGIFRSAGPTVPWQKADKGISSSDIRTLIIDRHGNLFAGTADAGVFRSTDGAESWQPANQGLPPSARVNTLATDCAGFIFAGTQGGGGFRSPDQGRSWTALQREATGADIYTFWVTEDEDLYARTSKGYLHSDDYGTTWSAGGLTAAGLLEDWQSLRNPGAGFQISVPTFRFTASNTGNCDGSGYTLVLEPGQYYFQTDQMRGRSLTDEFLQIECNSTPTRLPGPNPAYLCQPVANEGGFTHSVFLQNKTGTLIISLGAYMLEPSITERIIQSIKLLPSD